jgi:phosphotriesterase-related protein
MQEGNMKKLYMIIPLILLLCFTYSCQDKETKQSMSIMTVNGPIDTNEIGMTLTHEHVLVDFIGADQVNKDRYDQDEVIKVVIPFLEKLKETGCNTFIECTPRYMARDPELLKRLSDETGLYIMTNTGYCGAWENKYLPSYIFSETVDQLSGRMVEEWENGIDDTGIKPGFIKIAVDPGKLSETHKKIVQAAARAHLKTGLTIASHTGPAIGTFEQIEILKNEGVDPSAFIWVHAQVEKDTDTHLKAAEMGAWVSYDGLRGDDIGRYVELLSNMKSANLLIQVLLSHDAGFYMVGQPGGGNFVGYIRLFEELLPALEKSGFTESEIEQMIVKNPQNAFAYRVRKLAE